MAKCDHCEKDMLDPKVITCVANRDIEFPDGQVLESLSNHMEEESGRCHDCNIKHGGKHHPGCDVERCPKCLGQIISCGDLDEV